MKITLPLTLCLLAGFNYLYAQDIPLLSQKITNSFIYNPALAGLGQGSFTYAYKRNYSLVANAPENHFVSISAPFANHNFGMGLNAYQENVGIVRNAFTSAAFAWHLRLSKTSTISAGVAGEYTISKVTGESNTLPDGVDPVIFDFQSGEGKFDASAGVNFRSKYVNMGIGFNRLASTWVESEPSSSNYFSGYIETIHPLRGGKDKVEPYVAFRKLSGMYYGWDIGLFYTISDKIMGGGAYRNGNVLVAILAYKITDQLLLGFSRENIANSIGGFVGASNEVVLRYDFMVQNKKKRTINDCDPVVSYSEYKQHKRKMWVKTGLYKRSR